MSEQCYIPDRLTMAKQFCQSSDIHSQGRQVVFERQYTGEPNGNARNDQEAHVCDTDEMMQDIGVENVQE